MKSNMIISISTQERKLKILEKKTCGFDHLFYCYLVKSIKLPCLALFCSHQKSLDCFMFFGPGNIEIWNNIYFWFIGSSAWSAWRPKTLERALSGQVDTMIFNHCMLSRKQTERECSAPPTHMASLRFLFYTHMHTHTHVCVLTHTGSYTHAPMQMHVQTHPYTRAPIHACTCKCTNSLMKTHTHSYIRPAAHRYRSTNIQTQPHTNTNTNKRHTQILHPLCAANTGPNKKSPHCRTFYQPLPPPQPCSLVQSDVRRRVKEVVGTCCFNITLKLNFDPKPIMPPTPSYPPPSNLLHLKRQRICDTVFPELWFSIRPSV